MFTALSAISILALAFALSFRSFARSAAPGHANSFRRALPPFFSWIGRGVAAAVRPPVKERIAELAHRWPKLRLPQRDRRLAGALGWSFAYLALSGLISAWLPGVRLFGLFLLLHVGLGTAFAACLAAALVLYAGRFHPAEWGPAPARLRTALFWAFAAAGLSLIVTALAPMFPVLSTAAQEAALEAHRYSALASLLTGASLLYLLLTEGSDAGA
ncbi:MAG: hypothetical protein FJW35_18170 [Acidobacteria bacterium]|nr:hypothetical protein [Acidobacteriota bacterium]